MTNLKLHGVQCGEYIVHWSCRIKVTGGFNSEVFGKFTIKRDVFFGMFVRNHVHGYFLENALTSWKRVNEKNMTLRWAKLLYELGLILSILCTSFIRSYDFCIWYNEWLFIKIFNCNYWEKNTSWPNSWDVHCQLTLYEE